MKQYVIKMIYDDVEDEVNEQVKIMQNMMTMTWTIGTFKTLIPNV